MRKKSETLHGQKIIAQSTAEKIVKDITEYKKSRFGTNIPTPYIPPKILAKIFRLYLDPLGTIAVHIDITK